MGADLGYHQILISGEEFPWPYVTGDAKRTGNEVARSNFNGMGISIWVACNLT